jgi:hypothetical protein
VDRSKVGKLRIDVYKEVTVSEIGMKYKIIVEGKHLAEFGHRQQALPHCDTYNVNYIKF